MAGKFKFNLNSILSFNLIYSIIEMIEMIIELQDKIRNLERNHRNERLTDERNSALLR